MANTGSAPIYSPPPDHRPAEDIMGKGDLRTRRGKIYNGSYGKTRPTRLKKKEQGASKTAPRMPK